LREKGYFLRRSPVREPHFGPQRLRYDSRVRASYRHLSLAKRYWREAVEEEQIAKTLESAVQVQPVEDLLTWDEIAQEEERVATRGERKRESAQSPSPRPSRPQQQPKPVVKPKPVVNQVQPRQPRVRVDLSQRPSQQQLDEPKSKNVVRRIREEVERELAEKRKRERQFAQELDYSLKKQAAELFRSESPPPPSVPSYPKEKTPQEVGNVQNLNPFITQEVIEERKEEIQRKEQQAQVYQAEMRIIYRYRYFQGELTLRFRVRATWSAEKRKGIAAFLASVVVAYLYGFEFPSEALSFYGKFVEKEALAVREQVKRVVKKPFYSSSQEALEALSVKKSILVRVRVWQGDKLVEEHTFYLTEKSFTILHQYASEVRRRRPQPPQPGGQPPQGEPPEQPDYEDDYDRAPGM